MPGVVPLPLNKIVVPYCTQKYFPPRNLGLAVEATQETCFSFEHTADLPCPTSTRFSALGLVASHPLSVIRRAPPLLTALMRPLSSINFTTLAGGILRPSSSDPTKKYSTSGGFQHDVVRDTGGGEKAEAWII